ncbi:glutamate decarboxylase [Salmonella enterica subsp. enterica serovar Sarajane]|nr:glutamate decarboxylase [Salmonella enterica subsp. enterica serovar Sarajane]
MAVTAAKSVMAFRVLIMVVNLSRLTTGTINVNTDHERTLKASIIHQIQPIKGITNNCFDLSVLHTLNRISGSLVVVYMTETVHGSI